MKVSVVVTIYKEANNIEQLIFALLNQTKKADEIVIVDADSKDGTKEIVKKHPQIKLFIKQGNRSVGRNYGIEKAKGDIIAVTDGGGYPKKDWLEKITTPFKDKGVEIVSGYYESNAKTSFQKCIAPYFLVMSDKVKGINEFLPSSRSVAFKKTVWRKNKYPEEFSHNEDFVWDNILKNKGYSFYFESKAIVYWNPPSNILNAAKTFYCFSLGDAEANIYRSTVQFIYYRYIGALFILGMYKLALLLIPLGIIYVSWSILKNWKYVKDISGLFWLPIIQVVSDVSIMWGHLVGKVKA